MADESPTRQLSKPNYDIGFSIGTLQGGKIDYSVQTVTPKHKASEAELIEVQQTGSNEANFDLSFYANKNSTWNVYCDTNPYSNNGRKFSEIKEKDLYLNGKVIDKNPSDAKVVLSDSIYNLDTIVNSANVTTTNVPASPNICNINLG